VADRIAAPGERLSARRAPSRCRAAAARIAAAAPPC